MSHLVYAKNVRVAMMVHSATVNLNNDYFRFLNKAEKTVVFIKKKYDTNSH